MPSTHSALLILLARAEQEAQWPLYTIHLPGEAYVRRRRRIGKTALLLLPVFVLGSPLLPESWQHWWLLGLSVYAPIFLIPWYHCFRILAHAKSLPAEGWRFESARKVFVQYENGQDLRTLSVGTEDYLLAYRLTAQEYRYGEYQCHLEYRRPYPAPVLKLLVLYCADKNDLVLFRQAVENLAEMAGMPLENKL